jgi:glutamate-1-semialdehyde 2,1-aminomutase
MPWMRDWATPFPLFIREASCATLTDVDGHRYVDFCLGDSGAMFGHSPAPVAQAIARQASRGLTTMLPCDQSADAAAALADLFGLPWWQLTLTAADANRAVLRHARAITARSKVLVFNGSHFDVNDTVSVEFNDVVDLEAALAAGDVACVLTEPVMTHAGLVLPQPGFLEAVRAACTRHGTLLIIDETHTLSAARGGYARNAGIDPDFLVCGNAVAGGVPCGLYGFSGPLADRIREYDRDTTLSANPLSLAALLACLREVMTPAAYQHMDHLAGELAKRIGAVFSARGLPWHVARVGARVQFGRGPPPVHGSQSVAQADPALEPALHLYLLNRGFVLTPFHNMMLIAPVTTRTQIDGFMKVFEEGLALFFA